MSSGNDGGNACFPSGAFLPASPQMEACPSTFSGLFALNCSELFKLMMSVELMSSRKELPADYLTKSSKHRSSSRKGRVQVLLPGHCPVSS